LGSTNVPDFIASVFPGKEKAIVLSISKRRFPNLKTFEFTKNECI